MGASAAASGSRRQSRASRRSAAAASAEPPPIPAATGRFLVNVRLAPSPTAATSAKASAARRTRLPVPSSAPANGPSMRSVIARAGRAVSTSLSAANAMTLSIR